MPADRRDRIDLLLDHRLVRAAVWTALACAVPAVLLGWLAEGGPGALAALWGVGAVGTNGALAAAVSLRGGLSPRGIGVGMVVAFLPVRMVLLVAALAVAVGPLGLPAVPVVLATWGAELCVVTAQSVVVARGRTFVGPLSERRT